MADKPMVVLIATYPDMGGAEEDYKAVMAMHKEGDLGHVAAAVVTKADDGKLKIHRHDTTAKHLAWGGLVVGGLLGAIFPPLGAVFLAGSFIGGAALAGAVSGGVLAGFGGLVGHFWKQIPKDDLRQMGEMLELGQAGLVVVAVDKKQEEVDAVITRSEKKIIKKLDNGDVEGAYNQALQEAGKLEVIEAK
jgi:uncharacterized membrane protein